MDTRLKDVENFTTPNPRDMESMFILKEDGDKLYYDLTDTIYFDKSVLDSSNSTSHTIIQNDNLYVISREYYNTTKLWWLIASINEIDNPFDLQKMVGDAIIIPSMDVVGNILSYISKMN